MNIVVNHSKCSGVINLPASKSDLHRAIIAASLAKGKSVIEDVTLSNDIDATINACISLGANIEKVNNDLIIEGIKDYSNIKSNIIDVNESGSTLRFIIPLLSLFNEEFILKGKESLFSRPLSIYEEIYQHQNLIFELDKDKLKVKGKLKPDRYIVKGNISSQFISGLLFLLPLLNNDSTLIIKEPVESESYINMTLRTLFKFGIDVQRVSRFELFIKGNQEYQSRTYKIEKDYSQFAFYAVLGAINNDVTCKGLNLNSIQGDRIILDILKYFNVNYEANENGITIHKCSNINGEIINLRDCIDLGPILMVFSLFSKKKVKITNIKRLEYKESNRIKAMVENLRLLNAKIEVKDDYMVIYPSKLKKTKKVLNSFNDHRVMMALIVLATKIKGRTLISNPECIKKSYINFYKDFQSLGIQISLID